MKQLILFLSIFLTAPITFSQVKTEIINYKGWEKAIRISNKEVLLVVVPQIGRIMHYSYLDEKNLLYENRELEGKTFRADKPYKVDGERAHAGFGGDRIWPTVQDDFVKHNGSRGLSDPWIDGDSWDYKLTNKGVEITSKTSEYLGIKVIRHITLEEKGTTVNIGQKMEKVQMGIKKHFEPIKATIWNLSKVKTPEFGLLPLSHNSIFENSIEFQKWPDNINSAPKNYSKHGNVGQLLPVPGVFQKMGTDSKGWVAGVYDNMVFGQFFTFDKTETYPDGGTSATIFTCTRFTELECLSPEQALKVGETLEFNIKWKLNKLKPGPHAALREEAIKWLDMQVK